MTFESHPSSENSIEIAAFTAISALDSTGGCVNAYTDWHRSEWVPTYYDDVVYDPTGYDTFVWRLQQPLLVRIVGELGRGRTDFKYLDFACGTGRILAALEHLATQSVGVDTSASMVIAATSKTHRSQLKCGDIIRDDGLVDDDFDVITAFRFFLNNPPDVRRSIMLALAGRLRGPDSRLIFNMHGNTWSVSGLGAARDTLMGRDHWNMMSPGQVATLIKSAGLEIEACYGFGLTPRRLHRTRFAGLARLIDRAATRAMIFNWISQDLIYVTRLRSPK